MCFYILYTKYFMMVIHIISYYANYLVVDMKHNIIHLNNQDSIHHN